MTRGIYELTVQRRFSAAHALREYQGACSRLHGHNYEVEVVVARETLDELGMVVDFTELKRVCDEVIDGLDHRMLNDLPPFSQRNATSEHVAEYLYHEIAPRLQELEVVLQFVRVRETPTSAATYREV